MRTSWVTNAAVWDEIIPSIGYPAEVLADSPIRYFRLEETSGTVVADATGTADGTSSGVTLANDGAVGLAYSFQNASDYVSVGLLSGFGAAMDTAHTIEMFLRIDDTDDADYVYGTVNDGNTTAMYLMFNGNSSLTPVDDPGSKRFRLFMRDESNNSVALYTADLSAVFDDEWHHVVVRNNGGWSAANVTLWIDGVSIGLTSLGPQASLPAGTADFDYPLTFGAVNSRGTITLGMVDDMDEVAIYDYALSDARIAAHFAASGL